MEKSYSAVFSTNFDSVSVLTADQLLLHVHRSDFSPGQQTAIVDNCTNTHVWNDRAHFINFSPILLVLELFPQLVERITIL